MFFRVVAPTVIALSLKLIQATHLFYCKPLAFSIDLSLEKRFNYLFDLEFSKSKPFILSAISLPKFKLGWVPTFRNVQKIIFVRMQFIKYN